MKYLFKKFELVSLFFALAVVFTACSKSEKEWEKLKEQAAVEQDDSNTSQEEPKPAAESAGKLIVVDMKDMKFVPEEVTVKVGDTIQWKNSDITPHTATSDDWDSGMIGADGYWKYTFKEAGDFPYKCIYHPTMLGKVIVE